MKHTLHTLFAAALAVVFAASVAPAAPVGVSVNGVELDSGGSGDVGWTYVSPTLRLTNAGPFTISGENTTGAVRVVVAAGVTSEVTVSNLTLMVATNSTLCVFSLETNAVVSLFLAGTNTLMSGNGRAGLEVAGGRTLSITNAPGDDAGTLTASGGEGGAGIGGNNDNACGTVTINGGQIFASGRGYYGAGIGGGKYGAGGTITINGGAVTAQGGRSGSGIGGGYYHSGSAGTVAINGGVVTATGGFYAAGIGGGGNGQGGTVIISGGAVTAQGGTYGAGIGGGQAGAGENVTISGGTVTATGGSGGAGIGGGSYSGAGGNVTISGGTVTAIGSSNAKDIGPGNNGTVSGANIFTGGSIRLGASLAFHAPSNATEQVFCATLTGFAPNGPVTLTGLGAYGVNDIYADGDGCIYLWLPNGTHTFQVNGNARTVTIANGVGPTGVMVNGEEIASPAGPPVGWSFDATNRTLSLTGAGPFTISGTNGAGGVRVAVSNSVTGTVTLSNLTLRTGSGQSALALGTGAQLSLALAGTNTLTSGRNFAGIEVALGRTLSITNAPGDETATLTVTGGGNGAGIGGNNSGNAGTVNIAGGIITAAGGSGAAGIGGGLLGAGGTVNVSGGTVTAQGGNYGAGIGGGREKAGGTVNISGGMVTAIGGGRGAGIGGGSYDGTGGAGGTVNISGGTVFAQGADGGMDMGPGRDSTTFGANTFAGGSILLANDSLSPIPRNNNGKAIFCATVSGFVADARVEFTNPGSLPATYGTTDIFADDGGNIYLWLPNGTYTFTANGNEYTVVLNETTGATGVTVNGDEVAFGPDDPATAGWSYDEATQILRLTNAGPFTISGANTEGKVRVIVAATMTNAVTLSNLTLRTTNENRCIFTLGAGANVSLTLAGTNDLASGSDRPGIWVEAGETLSITNAPGDDAASLSVKGGANGAGIGSATQNAGGTVNISGGIITATSGTCAAGIGGGQNRAGGIVNISGGTVTAVSTYSGAGIGGGMSGAGGTVSISGGRVTATGSDGGAGIGGGNSRADGTVHISGGTVVATGSYGGADIGPGSGGTATNSNTFTGGSIYLANDNISLDPSNGTARVWCVTVTNLTPNAAITVTGLGTYGVNDLFADDNGKLYLWLPNNFYDFTADEVEYEATVNNADTTAIQKSEPPAPVPVGVTVNGIALDEAGSNGEGWTYVLPTLSLTNAGPFTISGTNTAGAVRVVVQEGVTSTVTLSNLTLVATNKNQCAFALETNAVVSFFLAGTNELASGRNRAGLEVAAGRTLSITNAPGDAAGALTATGGDESAGIGGGSGGAGGAVTISGGIVTANGSEFFGAGIGGGSGGGGGLVTISGGAVTANGGEMGAGIGSGGYAGWANGGDGGTVNITGGTVTANGGDFAAGIGGGDGDAGGTTTISGGEVSATGGKYGAGIGGGNNDQNDDGIAGSGGTVNISGGRVTATGGLCAAGIGGGTGQQIAGSAGADLTVSGGTLFATGGAGGAPGIGPGLGNVEEGETGDMPDASGTSTFTGGSIRIDGGYAAAAPSNNTARVWCVTVPDLTANAHIAVTSLPVTYGVNDLYADEAGQLYLWLPNASYDFSADGADYEATVSNADTTATPKSAPPVSTAYLTFSSADTFKVKPNAKTWNGTLEYSTNGADWNEFTTAGAAAATNAAGEYKLYICGTSNTFITGAYGTPGWKITAPTGTVACTGNIETLLDYATVNAGNHPAMANYCFTRLFYDCAALSSAPELPATNLTEGCYRLMFYNCTGLLEAPELPAVTMAEACYGSMFRGCAALTNAPALPATNLADGCYYTMFSDCTSLTETPALPATTMMFACYSTMFGGCASLTETPVLSAMTLANACYDSMFRDCTSLTRLPALPATNLTDDCYRYMFSGCSGIELNAVGPGTPWGIPAGAQPATDWNQFMLDGTGGAFTDDPVIGAIYYYNAPPPPAPRACLTFSSTNAFTIKPQTNAWDGTLECSTDMTNWVPFTTAGAAAATNAAGEYKLYICGTNNTRIVGNKDADGWKITAPTGTVACSGNIESLLDYTKVLANEHPVMADYCFANLFRYCPALSSAPELPATTLTTGCYYYLFGGCTGLTNAPALPATNLADRCYRYMFTSCSGLAQAPALPATTLAPNCYQFMFQGCSSLTNAPALPATTLASYCYNFMFASCSSLTQAPDLPATNLANYCYQYMFNNCSGLTNAPALPATTLAPNCYQFMFQGCTGLTRLPELPATQLANYCYANMFNGCTALVSAPELPATQLANYCYQSMFNGCTGITLYEDGTDPTWGIPADAQTATGWNLNMLANTGGTFTGDPAIGATYYYTPSTPPVSTAYLTFASTNAFKITPQVQYWEGVVEYSTDAAEWHELTTTGADAALGGFGDYRLYVRGTNNTCVGSSMSGWNLNATAPVICSGNIETLLDYPTVENGAHPAMAADCFGSLFKNWTWLVSAPALPAVTLAEGCYRGMFSGCTRLESAPAMPAGTLAKNSCRSMFEGCTSLTDVPGLPAGTLADYACNGMFKGCTGLATAPAFVATNLANYCCQSMFEGCTALTNAPALPAGTLATSCYASMFKGCTSLAEAPALPAATLANRCCYAMFAGCTGLTNAPALSAATLADFCYQKMFEGCTGLTAAPALAATTLASHCYASMFEGCTGLTRLPELPATTLDYGCYASMFKGCTNVALHAEGTAPTWSIPNDAAEIMGWNTDMLAGTGGTFTGDPAIGVTYFYTPSTPPVSTAYLTFASTNTFNITPLLKSWDGGLEYSTDAADWHALTTAGADAALGGFGDYRLHIRGTNNTCVGSYMFGWDLDATAPVACSGNIETLLDYPTVEAGDHPAMGADCFGNLFKDWTWLVSAPALPATTLTNRCYASMFEGCTSLESAPALTAATLAEECYRDMFRGCTALTDAPALPAGTLAPYCYDGMFKDCTSLTTAPAFAATNLAGHCCRCMFEGCTALTNAPVLAAGTLASHCYFGMFNGCTSLAAAPVLPATNLAGYCCYEMFAGCTSLTQAPALPAATLAGHCYYRMFTGCTGLAQTPALAATNLATHCYANMFEGCTALTRLPELPATVLDYGCYGAMFKDCTGITLSKVGPGEEWSIPADAQEEAGWNTDMLVGTGGSFTGDPVPGRTYYYAPPPPPGLTPYLTFASTNTFTITPQVASWDGTLEYSTNTTDWAVFTTAGAAAALHAPNDYRLHIRGTDNTRISDNNMIAPGWTLAATAPVTCSGDIQTLLDYSTVLGGGQPAMANYCFANLFRYWRELVSAPALPATNLTASCYDHLFHGCSTLETAPTLPAETLADDCYAGMFRSCKALTETPALASTNLADACYAYMFSGCTGLTNAPALPATQLASICYQNMFTGCTNLTAAPVLPATALDVYCYASMFEGCTGLTRLPDLPATQLASYCYQQMFRDCTGITLYADGTAPTWGIPDAAQAATNWNTDMLTGTGGPFTNNPVIGALYYYSLAPVAVEVVYDATGGAFAGGTSIVTQFCAAVYGQLPIANRNGYTLLGWFNGFAPGAAQAVSGGPLITNAPHRLHAHWTAAPGGTAASLFKYTINADGTITITGFKNPDQKAQKVVLPDRIDGRFVTGIAMGAFENSTSGMTEVYFPVFCTNIADKAFISVPSIKRLFFPPNRDWMNPASSAYLRIGRYAFSGAKGLTELTLPKTVVALGDFAFLNTRNLRNVTVLGEPIVGLQVFRSAGVDVGGVIVHLAPAMAADPDYMATFKQGMYNVTVRTDAVIAGIWMGKMRLAAPGGVAPIILNISVEKAAEWGEVNLSALRVEYRAKLDAASQVLLPSSAVREADGSITLELNVPDGDESGFFRVFAL